MTDVIAVDLGGTNIRAARVNAAGRILARDKVATPAGEGMQVCAANANAPHAHQRLARGRSRRLNVRCHQTAGSFKHDFQHQRTAALAGGNSKSARNKSLITS